MKLCYRTFLRTAGILLALGLLAALSIVPVWGQSATENPVYVVAIDAEFAPYEFVDAGGRPTGFTVKLLTEIGRLAGITFQFQPMSWPEAVAGLKNGDVDLINMIKTPERARLYAFSEAHSHLSQAIFRAKNEGDIVSLESLAGHRVALQQNDISMEKLASRTDFEKVIVHSKEEGFLLLNANKVDAFLAAEQPGIQLIQRYNLEDVEIAAVGLFPQEFCFTARRENTELIAELNGYLQTLKLSGGYDALADRWLSSAPANQSWAARHQGQIIWAVGLLAAFGAGIFIWNIALRRVVNQRTRELLVSRAQVELQANRLLTLVTHFPDGIALESSQRKIEQTNRQFCEMFGISDSPEAMVGVDCQQIAEKARRLFVDGDNFPRRVQEIIAAQRLVLSEELRLTDGRTFMRDYVPVRLGDTVEHLWHYRDITGHKQTEDALRKLSVATQQSPASIVITDPDGNIEYVNPKFSQITGYSAEEVMGQNPRILQGGEEPLETYEQLWDTILSGKEWRGRFHNKKKDGEFYWEDAAITPVLDDNGRIIHLLAVKEDITKRRQAEVALQESHQRLKQTLAELKNAQRQLVQQERLAAVGQLAAGIAHDFNNILTGILGFSELMQISPNTPASMQPKLKRISDSGFRAAALVSQLLDFSRKSVRQLKQIDLATFMQEAVEFLKRTIPENINIGLNFDPDNYIIEADPTQLQQVITNLAVNAGHSMPLGGTLEIRLLHDEPAEGTCCGYCGQSINGEWVILTVTDTGSGIPADVLPQIFEPFFTTKDVGQGSGLGLSQVAGIVEQHRGHITVDSETGRGTTFSVFLPPLSSGKKIADTASPIQLLHGQGETILLVEDEPTTLEAEVALLEYLEYEVLTATSGRQALTLYNTHQDKIALVLSDMIMPDMTGDMLFDALRAQNPDVKVAAVSGYPLGDTGRTMLEQGLVAWLKKPLSFEKLSQIIGGALSHKQGRWT